MNCLQALDNPRKMLSEIINYATFEKLSTKTLYVQWRAFEACGVIVNMIKGDTPATKIGSKALTLFKEGIAFLSLSEKFIPLEWSFSLLVSESKIKHKIASALFSVSLIGEATANSILALGFIENILPFEPLKGIGVRLSPLYYKTLVVKAVARIALILFSCVNHKEFKGWNRIEIPLDMGSNLCSAIYGRSVLADSSDKIIKGAWIGASLFDFGFYALKVFYLKQNANEADEWTDITL